MIDVGDNSYGGNLRDMTRMRVTMIKERFSPKFESNVLFCVVTFIPRYMMPSAAER